MAWLEPEVDTLRMDEARERQARRRHDNRGDSDLRDDERPPETLRQPAAARTLDPAGDDFDDVGSGSLPTGKDTEEHARERGHPERDRKHRSVQ